jgi:hypothetical protein
VDLALLTIRKTSVGTMANNVYLLTCASHRPQLLIDAADEPARIMSMLDEGGGGLDTIVTTHQHWDHHRALAQVVASTNAVTAAGEADADALPSYPLVVWCTATRSPSETSPWTSSTCVGTRRDPWRWPTTTRRGTPTSGLATRSSREAPGRPQAKKTFASLMNDLEERIFRTVSRRHVDLPRARARTPRSAPSVHILQGWRERGW